MWEGEEEKKNKIIITLMNLAFVHDTNDLCQKAPSTQKVFPVHIYSLAR
jgi:hypothetical protein